MPADSRSSPPSDETLSSGTRIQDLIVEQWVRSVPDGHHYRVVHAGTGRGATLHEYLPRAWARRHADGVRALPGHGQDFHAGVRRFLMKARQLRTLEHPALPVLLDAWTSHGTAFALMSPLPAQTLAEVVAAHGGRLPLAQAWPWICACFELAEWLHRQGKIYGAWDPHAIWVQEDQRLLMAAPEVDGGARPASAWVALEQSAQAPSGTKCGPWTDVFGIAAMAAFMLTGQTPTAARRLPLAAWMPAAPQATPRAGRRPPVEPPPRALLAAIRVSLLPNPRQRPQDIAQLKAMMGLGPQLPVLQEQARLGEPMGGDSTLDGDTVPMHELPDGPFLPPEGTTAPVAAQHAGVALPRTQTAPMPLDADLPPDSSARPSPPARRRRSPSAIALAGLLVVVVGVTWLAWRSERTADVVAHDASPAAAPQRALDQLVQGAPPAAGPVSAVPASAASAPADAGPMSRAAPGGGAAVANVTGSPMAAASVPGALAAPVPARPPALSGDAPSRAASAAASVPAGAGRAATIAASPGPAIGESPAQPRQPRAVARPGPTAATAAAPAARRPDRCSQILLEQSLGAGGATRPNSKDCR